MHGRKTVVCKVCNTLKTHYGLGMCSACLRQTKRRTKPEFYLGTQYSEIRRRCTTPDIHPSRSYYGLNFCTREDFIQRFKNDPEFLEQFKIWGDNGFQRGFAPSIDRLDKSKGYALDNMQILSNIENGIKDIKQPVEVIDCHGNSIQFESQKEAARYLGISPAHLCKQLSEHETPVLKNHKIFRINNE